MHKNSHGIRRLILAAWLFILATSSLPDILVYEIVGQVPGWLIWAKISLAFVFSAVSFFAPEIRGLWQLGLVIGVFHVAYTIKEWMWSTTSFQIILMNRLPDSFTGQTLREVFDLAAALVILVVVWALRRDPAKFFLSRGDIKSKIVPVRWLGIRPGTSIQKFGLIFVLIVSLSLLLILAPGTKLRADMIPKALSLLPAVFLVAALNSLGEEISFRVSLISTTYEILGQDQAVWMAAVFFGLAHYLGGQPSGIPGAAITLFLGWALGKIMAESKSILFPWFLHFVTNSMIFFFNELGTVL